MINFFVNVWKASWKNKLMIIGGTLILLGAVGGVIYGVVTRQGDEGLMKVGGKEIRWAKPNLPLTCNYDPNTITENHLSLYNKARSEINTRTKLNLLGPCIQWMLKEGMPIFVNGGLTLRVTKPDVAPPAPGVTTVEVEDPFSAHPGGITLYRYEPATGLLKGAAVFVDPSAPKELLERIWLHEVGHSLGLDHDRLADSIMYPAAAGRSKTLSEKDVKLLETTYR